MRSFVVLAIIAVVVLTSWYAAQRATARPLSPATSEPPVCQLLLAGDRIISQHARQLGDQREDIWVVERQANKHRQVRIEQRQPLQGGGEPRAVELLADRLIVQLQPQADRAGLSRWLRQHGARLEQPPIRPDLYRIAFDGSDPRTMERLQAALLGQAQWIRDVDRDLLARFTADQNIPLDRRFLYQWGLHNTGQDLSDEGDPDYIGTEDADIDAPEAWAITTGSPEVVVAVVDTGIYIQHEDLAHRIWVNPGERVADVDDDGNGFVDDIHGYNFYSNNGDLTGHPHGSHVAGIIGAEESRLENEVEPLGVVGVDWQARLLGVCFGGGEGDVAQGSSSDAIRSLDYLAMMRQNGVNIVASNHSYGFRSWETGDLTALRAAYERQGELGMLVVTSAGNDGRSLAELPQYPANFDLDCIITVGASDHDDQFWEHSNYDPEAVDLLAPGHLIFNAYPKLSWENPHLKLAWLSGTSMAAPHVTGALALAAGHAPAGTSASQLKQAIMASVDVKPAFADTCASGGRLNLHQALLQLPGGQAGGAYVVSVTPDRLQDRPLDELRIRFSRAMDGSSFSLNDDLTLLGPAGVDLNPAVSAVSWSDDRTLCLQLTPQRTVGSYELRVGVGILDQTGMALDQDLDGVPGQASDGFATSLQLEGSPYPRVVDGRLRLDQDDLVGFALRFSEAMAPDTWQLSQLVRLEDPYGRDLSPHLQGVSWEDEHRVLVLELSAQSQAGHYSIALAPGLQAAIDAVALDQDRDGQAGESVDDQYLIDRFFDPEHQPDAFGYIAQAHPVRDLLLTDDLPAIEAFDLNDDLGDALDLGSHRLLFYGNELTGADRLFPGEHGLLTVGEPFYFGEATGFTVQPFTTQPQMASIAPLWSNWYNPYPSWLYTPGSPSRYLLSRFEDQDGDSAMDHWVVQWLFQQKDNDDTLHFQLIADIDPPPGCHSSLIFNYPDLGIGNASVDEGAWGVVGITNVSALPDQRHVIANQRNDHPWVASGSAIRFLVPSSLAGRVWQDDNGDGTYDADETPLADVRVFLDNDADGIFDADETSAHSDADGWWILPHQAWGSYHVQVEAPAELQQVGPGLHTVDLISDQKHTGLDFPLLPSDGQSRSLEMRELPDHSWQLQLQPQAGSSADGWWRVEGLPASQDHLLRAVPADNS